MSIKSSNFEVGRLLLSSRRLQLRSPVMVISLFSSSSCFRNLSKSLNNPQLELGGLYHVEINIDLLLGFLISTTELRSHLLRASDKSLCVRIGDVV